MKLYKFLGCSTVIILALCSLNRDIPASIFSVDPIRLDVIPQPRQVTACPKTPACVLNDEWTIFVESTADETTRLAAQLIAEDLNAVWGLKIPLVVNDKALASTEKSIILGIPNRDKKIDAIATKQAIVLNPDLHPQGYKIFITSDWAGPGKILLLANAPQGLFYAAQTFRQLITRDPANQISLPPVQIYDWPLFDYRGIQINISQGIKMDYLKNLTHLLSYYKMNILALQAPALTNEEIAELAKEAWAHQITLIDNIATIQPNSSHHICADKSRCGHLNKKPLGWADSVLQEQRFLSRIPKTTIVLNPLEQNTNLTTSDYFEQIESFRKEGLDQILCPRISVNGDLFPDTKTARWNIYNATQAGLKHLDNNHKIMGLMLCQSYPVKGPERHFPETGLDLIAFTAECAWLPDQASGPGDMSLIGITILPIPSTKPFRQRLSHCAFGINGNETAEIIELLSSGNQPIKSDNLSGSILSDPFKSQTHLDNPNFYGSLQRIKSNSDAALKKIAWLREKSPRSKEILDTWHYAASQWQAFAEQFLTAREISNKYQDYYDSRYAREYAPATFNYQAIRKEYEELFDKHAKAFDALENEYELLISQRYDIAKTKALEPFKTAQTTWQDKKILVSEAIGHDPSLTPEELGISLARLPQRLVTPPIKPADLKIGQIFTWGDQRLHYRVLITTENTAARPAIGEEMFAYPVEIKLNFTELLKESGVSSSDIVQTEFDAQSVRVIEYSQQGTPIADIPFQMDKARHFNERFNAEVNLTWIIRKPIEARTTQYFYVYFDTTKNQAARYKTKYPYGELIVSGSDRKGFWLKNDRLKAELSAPPLKNNSPEPFLINSWVVRDFSTGLFSHLNLISDIKQGFGAIENIGPANTLSLQAQAKGPLMARFHAVSDTGDRYIFNFYENLPICEIFTDSRVNELHNTYRIPQSYLTKALKNKISAFSGAEYLSSSYNKGKIPPETPLNVSCNDSFWLAQKIVKGLTIAAITPENPVTHYLKTTPEDSDIAISFGVTGTKPFNHFIIYADTTKQDTFELLHQIKNIFTLDNRPDIQRGKTESQ